MKFVQEQIAWISVCALSLASSACAAEGTGTDARDALSSLGDEELAGAAAAVGTSEEPLVVGMPEEARATMGRERFGGHPEPWTPPPWPGPKPEK